MNPDAPVQIVIFMGAVWLLFLGVVAVRRVILNRKKS